MPKSKGRHTAKKHRARVNERNLIKKRQEEKAKREFMELMQKHQAETMKADAEEIIDVDELGDIGDFDLEDAEIVDEVINDSKVEKDEPTATT